MWIKLNNGTLVNLDKLAGIEPIDRKKKSGEDVYCVQYFGDGFDITEEFYGESARNMRIALLKEELKIK